MSELFNASPGDMPKHKPIHSFTPPPLPEQSLVTEQPHEDAPQQEIITGLSGMHLTKAIHRALNGQRPHRKPAKGKSGYYPGKLIDMSAPLID